MKELCIGTSRISVFARRLVRVLALTICCLRRVRAAGAEGFSTYLRTYEGIPLARVDQQNADTILHEVSHVDIFMFTENKDER